jgi:hypothetical protein
LGCLGGKLPFDGTVRANNGDFVPLVIATKEAMGRRRGGVKSSRETRKTQGESGGSLERELAATEQSERAHK